MTKKSGETIGAALAGAQALLRRESTSPALDAELLLAHILKRPREQVIAHRDDALAPTASRDFSRLVRRRATGVPLPYLAGSKEFYGRSFLVNRYVMVPRPETEELAREAIRLLAAMESVPGVTERAKSTSGHTPRPLSPIVADIGTGSGVLAVTLAAEAPHACLIATDRSRTALATARRNARRQKAVKRIMFIQSDLLTEIPSDLPPRMIVANLPYMTSETLKHAGERLDTRPLTFEPQSALDGGPDGLFVIRKFFAQLARMPNLTSNLEELLLEHAPDQRRAIVHMASDAIRTFQAHEVSPYVTRWSRGTKKATS